MHIGNVAAAIFDMDGTLIDSELLTEPVIREFCKEAGTPVPDFTWTDLYGVSWHQIATDIGAIARPPFAVNAAATRLHELYLAFCERDPPPPVPGAQDAIRSAHERMPTAIVSSSYREAIDAMIHRLRLGDHVTCRAGADDYPNPKPAPDGFLHAAELLGVTPENCIVFEDSLAGIHSARAAGMRVVAVTHRSNVAASAAILADLAIRDFNDIEEDFFDLIRTCAAPAETPQQTSST